MRPGRPVKKTRRRHSRLVFEQLEERQLLSTFTVNNTKDDGSTGTLRWAIGQANATSGANTINFDSTVFATDQTITLTGTQLELTNTTGLQTITGPAAGVTISGGHKSRVFEIDFGDTASFSGLTITDGTALDDAGGLYSQGTLTLTDCTVSGNTCTQGGVGGIGFTGLGTLTIIDSAINGNSAPTGLAGGLELEATGQATLTNVTVSGNSGQDGGGLYVQSPVQGAVTLNDCTVSGNTSSSKQTKYVGGIHVYGKPTFNNTIVAGNTLNGAASDIGGPGTVSGSNNLVGTGGSGGLVNLQHGNIVGTSLAKLALAPLGYYGGPTETMPLLYGSVAIGAGTAESGVTTDQRGFPLDNPQDIGAFQTQSPTAPLVVSATTDVNLSPPGTLSLRAAVMLANLSTTSQAITFDPTVFATLQTITLSGLLELSNKTASTTTSITGPAAGVTISGGNQTEIFEIDPGVTATLSGLTITDGSVAGGGGGLSNSGTVTLTNCTVSNNTANYGGGLENQGSATLTDCTISGNSATAGDGGGLSNGGTLKLTNSTVYGNSAHYYGGGLQTFASTVTTLTNVTVSGNSAKSAGGGLYLGGAATLNDTIVASNTVNGAPGDFGGPGIASGSNNLIGTGGSAGLVNLQSGNIVLTSLATLGLGPLGAYGGPIETMALLPGSAAIGAGAFATGVTTDERGLPRGSSVVDIGAFQASLVVESNSGTVVTTAAGLTLPGAVSLANQFTGSAISFDRNGLFANPQTITLTFQLELENTHLSTTVTGPPAGVTISGGNSTRDFQIDPNVTASLSGLTITGGFVSADNLLVIGGGGLLNYGMATLTGCTVSGNSGGRAGGGIQNNSTLVLNNCTVNDNQAEEGAGLYNAYTANLTDCTITGCTINGNTTPGSGGGIYSLNGTLTVTDCTLSGDSAGLYGGGICSASDKSTLLTVTGSTFSGNYARYGGGGLDNRGGMATLTNVTVSGNTEPTGFPRDSAAGLVLGGTVMLNDCTVSGNTTTSTNGYGVGGVYSYGTVSLENTIVAGNTDLGVASDFVSKTSASGSHNLFGTGGSGGLVNGQNGNIVLTSLAKLGLDKLANDGGASGSPATETMALLPGSAAIGAGVAVTGVTTDQRGLTRGSVVDIGAFQASLVVESTSGTVVSTAAGLTLRGAVGLADQFAGSDITFDPTVFAAPQTITLTSPLELSSLSETTTITGPAAGLTISGGNHTQIFKIDPQVTASFSELTITAGSTTGSGGGLYNKGTATLTDCTVSGNSAGSGGGVYSSSAATLTLTDCTVSGNSAATGTGGGLDDEGAANLYASTVSGNSASTGGGLYLGGTATLTDTIVAGNTAHGAPSDIVGPGTASGSYNLIGTGGSGGLTNGANDNIVLTSHATLGLGPLANNGGPTQTMALLTGSPGIEAGTTINGITTDQRGQPLDTPAPDIGAYQTQTDQFPTHTFVVTSSADDGTSGTLRWAVGQANAAKGIAEIEIELGAAPATITLSQGQLELSNTAQPVTIYDGPAQGPVTISGNNASRVFQIDQGVTASLTGLTISAGLTSGSGGGLCVQGTAILTACTISGNSANDGGGIASVGSTTLTDCTISGNTASSSGGGLYEPAGGILNLTDSTVSANTAATAGGVDNIATATLNLKNTIVAGNTLANTTSASDIGGTAIGTNNLLGTGGAGGLTDGQGGNIVLTSLTGLDLGPLASNGGLTQTMDLLPGSLAIGAGVAVTGITTDQRGLSRSNNGTIDIGAVEDQVSVTPPSTATTTQTGVPTVFSLGSFSDGAGAGPYAVSVQWGDQSSPTNYSLSSTGSLGSQTHDYTTHGTDTITVTITDGNGDEKSLQTTATVNAATTSAALSASQSSPSVGQVVTFTETVAPPSGDTLVPTGSVVFQIDGSAFGNPVPLNGSGAALITTSTLALGNHTITATYTNSDGNFNPPSAPQSISVSVGALATTTTLSASLSSPLFGQTVTFTATTAGTASGEGTPTGTIQFDNNGTSIHTATLVGGTATFTTSALAVASYSITAIYSGSTTFGISTSTPLAIAVGQATPTVSVSDSGGSYDGSPFSATATVVGVSGTAQSTLEGVTPSLTYYAGSAATGTPLAGAPSAAGTYTVMASFGGSTDYSIASDSTTFTIAQARPTLTVSDPGGTYNGMPFRAAATVAGVVTGIDNTPGSSLEGVTPSLTYYRGNTATGTALGGAPSVAGSYTAQATFAGSTDYSSVSETATFTIGKATPTLTLADAGGSYDGHSVPAVATVAGVVTGVDSTPEPTLESVAPVLTYYIGTYNAGDLPASGGSGNPPTAAGSYTVTADFPGSADYVSQTAFATFQIARAMPVVSVTDAGGTYTGSTFPATDTVAGVVSGVDDIPAAALEDVTPSLMYYTGTTATGTPLTAAPIGAGVYTVQASFPGSTDYAIGAATTTFTIAQATPTITLNFVSTYGLGSPVGVGATITGVSGGPVASLEGVSLVLTYHDSLGNNLGTTAPTALGNYSVVGSFAGSADYMPVTTASTTFSIVAKTVPTITLTDAGGS